MNDLTNQQILLIVQAIDSRIGKIHQRLYLSGHLSGSARVRYLRMRLRKWSELRSLWP
jgi:hypothetical protein